MREVSPKLAPPPVLLPATKTADRPPARAIPDGFVSRAELVERLLASRDAALAMITAPAGYGKSTLLAEWDRCDDRPFAWVSLDPCDDARLAITSAIAGALEQTGSIDADAWPELMWSTAGDETSALRRLIGVAKRRGDGFVLVIDDAHTVTGTAVWAVVTALLGQLGAGAQLAVASRTEPPLAIGRLRAHRSLIELRTADLAMDPEQAASLLALAGLKLDPASTRALLELTEGWPVGLYLAALSLRGEPDLPAAVKRLRGDDHLIAEYFRDELLSRLSSDCWRFLTRVSVLDDLSGPLCDAVLEQTAGGEDARRAVAIERDAGAGRSRPSAVPAASAVPGGADHGAASGRAGARAGSAPAGQRVAGAARRPRRGDRPRRRRPATWPGPVSCCAQTSPGCSRPVATPRFGRGWAASAPSRSRPRPRSRSRRRTAA